MVLQLLASGTGYNSGQNDFLRVVAYIGVVAVVLVLAYFVSKWIASRSFNGARSRYFRVLDRVAVSKDKIIMLVEAGKRYYIVAVAENTVSTMAEIPQSEVPDELLYGGRRKKEEPAPAASAVTHAPAARQGGAFKVFCRNFGRYFKAFITGRQVDPDSLERVERGSSQSNEAFSDVLDMSLRKAASREAAVPLSKGKNKARSRQDAAYAAASAQSAVRIAGLEPMDLSAAQQLISMYRSGAALMNTNRPAPVAKAAPEVEAEAVPEVGVAVTPEAAAAPEAEAVAAAAAAPEAEAVAEVEAVPEAEAVPEVASEAVSVAEAVVAVAPKAEPVPVAEATPEPEAEVTPVVEVAATSEVVPEAEAAPEAEAEPAPEVAPEPEAAPEVEAAPEAEATPEAEAVPVPEAAPEVETEAEATPEVATETEAEAAPEVEAVPEPEVEAEPEVVPVVEAEAEPEPVPEPAPTPEVEAAPTPEPAPETKAPAIPEPAADIPDDAGGDKPEPARRRGASKPYVAGNIYGNLLNIAFSEGGSSASKSQPKTDLDSMVGKSADLKERFARKLKE